MPFGGLLTVGLISAGTSLAGGIMGSRAAGKAADVQADATRYAADKQSEAADKSLAFTKDVYADQKANLAPYQEQGRVSLAELAKGLQPEGEFAGNYDASQLLMDDPGYNFRLSEGLKAVKSAASATGTLGSGATLKALSRYGQDYASGEYNNVWNRFQAERGNRWNRIASLAGIGQTATNAANNAGTNAANTISSINLSTARGIGDAAESAANASASGYIGAANAWSGALANIGNTAQQALLLSQLKK